MKIDITRFPRTEDKAHDFMVKARIKHPPPSYDPRTDGSVNPAEWVLDQLLKYSKKKLRRLCKKHALEPLGLRRRLVWRLWMHWRAKKLMLGKVYIGYGKGYEHQFMPTCVCGYLSRDYINSLETRKISRREQKRKSLEAGKSIRRFPRLVEDYPERRRRFPRLKEESS